MFPVHVVFLALVPTLFLFSNNAGQARYSDMLVPAGLTVAVTLALLVFLRLVLKDWQASALIVSSALVLFFTYGRVTEALGDSGGVQVAVAALYVALLFLASVFAVKKKGELERQTKVLNVMAVTLLLLSAAGIAVNAMRKEIQPQLRSDEVRHLASSGEVSRPDSSELPDIYYIILDGYASQSTLEREFGFDNSDFVEFLQGRGFFVAGDSRSNYCQSRLSLSSSLNLKYINYLTKDLGRNSRRAGVLNRMIEDNGLALFLKSMGYHFAFFGSNWSGTRSNRNADTSVTESNWLKGEFMVALLKTTSLRPLIGQEEGLYTREGVLRAFSVIPEMSTRVDGPLFVFAHIVPPHRPFLFDRNGGPLDEESNDWSDTEKYIDQLIFVNNKTRELVDEILDNSEKPPVIVIQADHGPMPGGDPEVIASPDARTARLRSGILNAYYLPGGEGALYGSISPVNSFRVILNDLFGLELELLEDRSYSSSYSKPYDFRDITDLVREGTSGR